MSYQLFRKVSYTTSEMVTKNYSTSFSMGIKLLGKSIRPAIYAIYGFVRYADEIVDTFHEHEQEVILNEFIEEYNKSLIRKFSMHPILHAFQEVVLEHKMQDLVESFLASMKKDLNEINYHTEEEYAEYIYGSADVVGLMCLKVFVGGDEKKYNELKPAAMRLGSGFQKVNFLRDIQNDFSLLGRSYFPNLSEGEMSETDKKAIIDDISADFAAAKLGIQKLPARAKLGVYLAYNYYHALLKKIEAKPPKSLYEERIRIPNYRKAFISMSTFFRFKLNLL